MEQEAKKRGSYERHQSRPPPLHPAVALPLPLSICQTTLPLLRRAQSVMQEEDGIYNVTNIYVSLMMARISSQVPSLPMFVAALSSLHFHFVCLLLE